MGYYYIYTVLKIVHKYGVEHIVLKKESIYLHEELDNDVCINPLNINNNIDLMKIDLPNILVYKKEEFKTTEYMTIVEEQIKCNLDEKYKSTNKYVKAMDKCGFHLDKGKPLNSIDDIIEIYIIETQR
jgi:hypothetical protein